MYEERVIAFVDILGFGTLVDRSENEPDLPRKIFQALSSIHPTSIQDELVNTVNVEFCTPEEVGRVREMARMMAVAQQKMHPVHISYFSDSLVISARADDVVASQMVLDLLTKISAMMWMSHGLLLRGGVTIGSLIHSDGGPMFGPAMNRAYHLESKLAKYPRLLIDEACIARLRQVHSFELFESFVREVDLPGEGRFYYASLATAFKHIINDSALAASGEKVLRKFRVSMLKAPDEIEVLRVKYMDDNRIGPKYEWLGHEMAAIIPEVAPAYPCEDDVKGGL